MVQVTDNNNNINNYNSNNNNGIQRLNLLTALRTVSNTYAQVAQAQPRANHVQHIDGFITCNMLCYVPRGIKGQLSY